MSSEIRIKILSVMLAILLFVPLLQMASELTVLTSVLSHYFVSNGLRDTGGQLVTQASSGNSVLVPLNSPVISNGVACIQFNNPPPYPGNTYPIHWDVFKFAINGGNPSNYSNLFIGDLTGSGTGGNLFYDTGYGNNDGSPGIGPYTHLYITNSNTIMGVINASNGLTEVAYYELVGRLPVVYVNFTVNNAPQPTEFWYGLDFISNISITDNPGETSWVIALGVGNLSFPAQNPQEMYNMSVKLGFNVTFMQDTTTPGNKTVVYIPASVGKFAWMEIDQPGVGVYYLALYPLTPIQDYIIFSNSGWAFAKIIGLVFANDTRSASGALLVVYGSSLSQVEQNIQEALSVMNSTPTSTVMSITSTSSSSTATSSTSLPSTTAPATANHSTVMSGTSSTGTTQSPSTTGNQLLQGLLTNNQLSMYLIGGVIVAVVVVVVVVILTKTK